MKADERIQVIEKSLRIFVCGLLSLIPVIGLVLGLYAAFAGARLHSRCRGDWNPAAEYLNWGMVLSLASLGLSVFIIGLIVVQSL
ncbi:MAG TPA: hypothetical protein VK327_06290 [Candidatus Paceibacterota bacterium]|nr:hypothetical protein [Candidatus Paceibacterota bacterium]